MTMSIIQSRADDTDEITLTLKDIKVEFDNIKQFVDKLFVEASRVKFFFDTFYGNG